MLSTNTISGADIDTDGYDDFELEVIESEKLEKRKILNNKDLDKLNRSLLQYKLKMDHCAYSLFH